MTAPPATARTIPTLAALRGIAALAVCWFHVTDSSPAGWLKASGSHGWMGVELFFVVSGFVIPYSMFVGGYRSADFGRFLGKRLVRLDPPYLASLALTLVLGWASTRSPSYRGAPYHPSLLQVLAHVGYVNVFFGYAWLNLVYWTLVVELQFYVLVAIVYPLLVSPKRVVWTSTFIVLAGSAWLVRDEQLVPVYLPVFLLGMTAFKRRVDQLDDRGFALVVAVLGVLVVARWGWLVTAVVVATTLIVTYVNASVPGLSGLGTISYSLYLVHMPVGGRAVNLGARFVHSQGGRFVVAIVATVVSIGTAWVLYVLVERPAQRWSSRIRFRSGAPSATP